MQIPYVFGVDYETASFEIREEISFLEESILDAIQRIITAGLAKEVLILSTCNRTEIYCVTQDIDFVINAICDIQNLCPRTIRKHSYVYSGLDCANHLFRVASGLESMVLGETEIVYQLKSALNIAKMAGGVSTHLAGLFQMAFSVEKEVRTTTAINNIAVSMGNAVVNLVAVNTNQFEQQKILFVGAGQIMQQIAPHFKNINFLEKAIVNRTLANAENLANRINAKAYPFEDLAKIIHEFSIIIICYHGGSTILDKNILAKTIANSNKNLLIVDLSMPLVSDLHLRNYPNINLITIDEIQKIVDVGIEKRKVAADGARNLIEQKLAEYAAWLEKRGMSHVIKALRENADRARLEVLTLAQRQLDNGEDVNQVLTDLSIKLMNKLIHHPTVNLSSSSGKDRDELTGLVSYLYGLEVSLN